MIYGLDWGSLWFVWMGSMLFFCCWAAHDDAGFAVFWLFTVGTALFFAFAPPAAAVLGWLVDHRNHLPYLALLYVAVGTSWGIMRWCLYVSRAARSYEGRSKDLLREYQNGPWSPGSGPSSQTKITYAEWLYRFHSLPPSPSNNRSRIVTWMVWWPFSFLDTLLSDLVRRVFDAIYDEVAALLGRISTRAFRRFEELR